jgi:hypothetical protein
MGNRFEKLLSNSTCAATAWGWWKWRARAPLTRVRQSSATRRATPVCRRSLVSPRLKLKYDELLFKLCIQFQLAAVHMGGAGVNDTGTRLRVAWLRVTARTTVPWATPARTVKKSYDKWRAFLAGAYTRPLFSST